MNLREALNDAQDRLAETGVDSPGFDARALAAHVLRLHPRELPLHDKRLLSADELAALDALVAARTRREPLQYLLRGTEFYGLEFRCDRRSLVPRPDTETVIDVCLELSRRLGIAHIADLGTGTGIIALTLATMLPEAEVLATDASEEALALAAENLALHRLAGRVTLAHGPWLEPLREAGWAERVQMIVSNPPYVRAADYDALMPEICEHEPRAALVGPGEDGLGAYRAIVAGCADLPALRALVFEVGDDQAASVAELISAALAPREVIIRKDLGGHERVVAAVLGD